MSFRNCEIVKILDVLCVHLEEGRELDDDVADPLVLLAFVPRGHAVAELEVQMHILNNSL